MMLEFAELIKNVTFLLMFVGIIATIIMVFRKKEIKQGVFCVVIPFYVIHYILKMPETRNKKLLAISTMGCFTAFLLASIFQIIMTPPM